MVGNKARNITAYPRASLSPLGPVVRLCVLMLCVPSVSCGLNNPQQRKAPGAVRTERYARESHRSSYIRAVTKPFLSGRIMSEVSTGVASAREMQPHELYSCRLVGASGDTCTICGVRLFPVSPGPNGEVTQRQDRTGASDGSASAGLL